MRNFEAITATIPGPSLAWRRWLALPVILSGTFMVTLDFFIVNVAIPSIQSELHTGAAAVEWLVAGYALRTRRC